MQRFIRAIAILVLAVLPSAPAAAAEPGWTLRLHGAWVKSSISLPQMESDVPIDIKSNSALGAGAALEYCVRGWIGVVLDGLHARPGIVLEADLPDGRHRVVDNLGFTPISVGPVLHVTPGKAIDLMVTATAGVGFYGDLMFTADGQELKLQGDSTFVWSVGAAVDIRPWGSNWAIHAGVSRFASNPTFTNLDNGTTGSAALNPVVVAFGVAFRF